MAAIRPPAPGFFHRCQPPILALPNYFGSELLDKRDRLCYIYFGSE